MIAILSARLIVFVEELKTRAPDRLESAADYIHRLMAASKEYRRVGSNTARRHLIMILPCPDRWPMETLLVAYLMLRIVPSLFSRSHDLSGMIR
jgi:hypothetical protein